MERGRNHDLWEVPWKATKPKIPYLDTQSITQAPHVSHTSENLILSINKVSCDPSPYRAIGGVPGRIWLNYIGKIYVSILKCTICVRRFNTCIKLYFHH